MGNHTIKVVGLDPSMSNLGMAFATIDLSTMKITIDEFDLALTSNEKDKKVKKVVRKNSEDLERARVLHKALTTSCTSDFALAFAEMPVGSQSARAMASYGVCMGVLAACPIPMIQTTATEGKLVLTGIKTATKEEMIEAAIAKYPDAPWPTQKSKGLIVPIAAKCEHLADAVAAIEAGILTDQFKQLVSMMKSMR